MAPVYGASQSLVRWAGVTTTAETGESYSGAAGRTKRCTVSTITCDVLAFQFPVGMNFALSGFRPGWREVVLMLARPRRRGTV